MGGEKIQDEDGHEPEDWLAMGEGPSSSNSDYSTFRCAVPHSSFFFPSCAAQLIQIPPLPGLPNTVTHGSPGLSLTLSLLPISFMA